MTNRNQTPTCCFCCHVKVGTFVLAILYLIAGTLNVIGASYLLSNSDQEQYYFTTYYDEEYSPSTSRSALWFALGNGLLLFLVAVLTILGISKNRPGLLLPLFIVQVFDFICLVVYIGSLMFYWPTVKLYIATCQSMPDEWKEWLLNLDDRWLAVLVFSIAFVILFIRCYLIALVYRCYKFITSQALLARQHDPEINCVVTDQKSASKPIYNPPKYEDIQKVPLVEDVEEIDTKPPPYVS